jgi:non-specific protein-tyrosine kinase
MDLKVSIDKAKKLRLQTADTPPASSTGQAPEQEAPGWSAPIYHDCRSVIVDPDTLRKNHCVCFFPDAPELGHYKLLRTQIVQRCKPHNWNTIMITSALPGEGKTVTSINLAFTFARAFGQTALLVDCDFQRQLVHQYLGVSSSMGLADYLQNGTPLKDLILWPGVEKLTFISGGNPIRNSAELISSPAMAELMAEMKNRYPDRYLLFDLPPLLVGADALAFAPLVDCIILVVQPTTSFDDLRRALDLVPKEKLLGFVLNRVEASGDDYYYYRYRYGRKKP